MTLAGFEERTDDPPRPHSDVGPAMTSPAPDAPPVSPARKWAITVTVMVVAFMQILSDGYTTPNPVSGNAFAKKAKAIAGKMGKH